MHRASVGIVAILSNIKLHIMCYNSKMETKMCKKCNTEKTYDLFVKDAGSDDGLFAQCKSCHNKRMAGYRGGYKLKKMAKTDSKKECRMCGEMKAFISFKHGKQLNHTYCAACRKIMGFNANLERYGLTPEQYVEMLDKQGGVCAICKKPEAKKKRLAVDHDHSCCSGIKSCGKCIRGLLCSLCNNGLGSFQDDVQALRAAVDYLS